MRSVLTLSLPAEKARSIRAAAKKRGLSLSTYFIHTYEIGERAMTEDDILADLKEARRAQKAGEVYTGLDTLRKMVGLN